MLERLGHRMARVLGERPVQEETPWAGEVDGVSVERFLPWHTFDPDTKLFFNRDSTGFVLEMDPLVGCDDGQQKMLARLFELPEEGSGLQFGLWADPGTGHDLKDWAQTRTEGIFREMALQRADFLQKTFPVRNFRVWMSYVREGVAKTALEEDQMLRLAEQMTGILQTAGFHPRFWTAEDLLGMARGLLDGRHPERPVVWNRYDPLRQQGMDPDWRMQVTEQEVRIAPGQTDSRCLRVYRASGGPKLWAQGAMQLLIGDPFEDRLRPGCPFMVHTGIWMPSQDRVHMAMSRKASWVEKQALSPVARYLPSLGDEYEEHRFVRGQTHKGIRFVQSSWSLVLQAPASRIGKEEQTALSLFRSQEWHLVPERYTVLPSVLSTLPLMWGRPVLQALRSVNSLKTTVATEAANIVPLQGEWKGTGKDGMLLAGRRGQVFRWSPFDNREGNYNVCVTGYSGSGKSVFMQDLLATVLGLGGRVFVMDVGRSFQNTCRVLGGQFMAFDKNLRFSLNPFDHADRDDETIAMITAVLGMMVSPAGTMKDLERALVEAAVIREMGMPCPSIRGVVETLRASTDPRSRDLALVLGRFAWHEEDRSQQGIYGRFFHEGQRLAFHHPLVVMELEELKGKPDLQAVVFQTVILAITHQMMSFGRKQKFCMVLDEAWDLLRGEQAGKFIEMLARRLRKYNGSLVVGTQNLSDFRSSPAAEAAFANSSWLCLLAQKDEEVERAFAEQGGLFPAGQTALKKMVSSIQTRHGVFSEIGIKGPSGLATGRLVLDPFSKLLYSTTPKDWEEIESRVGQGLRVEEAITDILAQRAAQSSEGSSVHV